MIFACSTGFAGASNVDAAMKFMNFIMVPENIAISSNFTRYANTITGSPEFFDDSMKSAPELATPTVPVEFAQACSAKAQKLIERVWTQLLK
jgi:spermidine/putrescine transport system substrate-binding protein